MGSPTSGAYRKDVINHYPRHSSQRTAKRSLDVRVGGVKTERRHLESEALVTLASYVGDWTVLLDEKARIVYELGSCDVLFGGEGRTSIGRRITAFVHPDDMELATDKMADSLSKVGSQVVFEIRAGLGDSSYRKVDVLAVNCFHDRFLNGVILRVTGRAD